MPPDGPPEPAGGMRYMAASALFFSVMSLLVKEAGKVFPTLELVFVRGVIVAAIAFADLRRRRVRIANPDFSIMLWRGAVGLGALTCFYFAVIHLPLAEATVLHFTNPIWTALLAAIFLREGLRGRELALALGSLAGVVLVARPFGLAAPLDPWGIAAALMGAVLAAGAYVLVRRLRSHDSMLVVWYFAVVSVVIGLPAMLPAARWPHGAEWLLLLGIGVATFLGQITLTVGLKRERAGAAMGVGYLQVLFAAVWGVIFFGETILPTTVAGAVVILACTLLLARLRRHAPTA